MTFRKIRVLSVFFSILGAIVQGSRAAPLDRPRTKPNIVILLADDMGYGDLGCYGHPSIKTPALDRLAAEGQRWTDFYATAPVCSPTRGALMTGKLPVRSGLYGIKNSVFWPNSKGGIPAGTHTLAEVLRDAGYDTAMLGKWHLGDTQEALPTRHGFDRWLGLPYSNDMDWVVAPNFQEVLERMKAGDLHAREQFQKYLSSRTDPNRKSSDWNVPLIASRKSPSGIVDEIIERPAKQENLTKLYTEEAVSFIRARSGDHPFFLYVAYNMPHMPTFASGRFVGKSSRGAYGDAVEEIDWSVNEIHHALKAMGLEKNTLVVFASDNGPDYDPLNGGSAGPLKGYKGTTLEGGMRVPGIFWWPGYIESGVVHGLGNTMDLYATAAALAGVSNGSSDSDSVDLSPVFEGRQSPRTSLSYYSAVGGQLLAYRSGAWKVSFSEDGFKLSDKIRLYNLEFDPSELKDLSSAYPDILKNLIEVARSRDAAVPRAAPIFDQ